MKRKILAFVLSMAMAVSVLAGCGTVGGKGKELSKIEAEDEYGNSVKIMTDHSYSAINADDEYVYLTEPSGKYGTIKMTHKSFKSAFNHANFTDLN